MDRENFRNMFNGLLKSFNPKNKFEFDDYYDQIKFIPDSRLDDLRKKIISTCSYFPKPAELKEISKEFKLPFQKLEHPDINYDNCMHCGKPVYNSFIDPYRCKDCYEKNQQGIQADHERLTLNMPVDMALKEDKEFNQLLNDIRNNL